MRIYAKQKLGKLNKGTVLPEGRYLDPDIITGQPDLSVDCWKIVNRRIIPNNVLLRFTAVGVSERKACRKWYDMQLANNCRYCGEAEPKCLLFHHRIPGDKVAPIAPMVKSHLSLDMIQAEANKCDVVCRNCHIKLHCGVLPITTARKPRSAMAQVALEAAP